MTGTVLAERYVLGASLGSGGMGRVHRAVDLKLQREVAVKLLASPSPSAEIVLRFKREALSASSLQHANVVRVFDAGEQQGQPFLVTELLQGETLRQRLARGPIAVEQVRAFARQLAAGLAAAHEKGLIHRDLKPSNIFLTADNWVKILDFGLAKLAESLPLAGSEGEHRVVGTIGYMAPEQVRGQQVDVRADLFNFGLVLYEMLGGKRAFEDVSATETSYAIVLREPAPLPPGVPLRLRRLVDRCLEKDREKRPASAREVLDALQAPEPPRRRWRTTALLLLPVLALGFLAVRGAFSAPPSGSVAVLMFDGREAPESFAYTSGLSELLTLDLEGTALRPVDQEAVNHAFKPEAAGNLERARTASLQLGAKYFVEGALKQRGGELFVEATLRETESSRTKASAAAHGKPEAFLRLVRQLSDQLQRKPLEPAEFDARLLALQRRLTPSVPALQAWLEAEHYRVAVQWEPLREALRRTVKLDPDFALAQFRLGSYLLVSRPDEAEASLKQALRFAGRLTPFQRLSAQSDELRLEGKLAEADQVLLAATREHPEDARIWGRLAWYQMHRGEVLGRARTLAIPAWQKTLEMDPQNVRAMRSLLELAQLNGEREVVTKLADRLLSMLGDRYSKIYYGLARAWALGDAAEHDELLKALHEPGVALSTIADAVSRTIAQLDGSSDPETIADLLPFKNDPQGLRAMAHLFRGHPKSAREIFGKAAAAFPGGRMDYYRLWVDSLEHFEISPAELAASRTAAANLDTSKDRDLAPAKHHLMGLLALRARDFKAAEASAAALSAQPELPNSSIAADLSLALQARILFARGDARAALARLDERQIRIPERYTELYNTTRENLFRGQLLVALGRPREALPLYQALYGLDVDHALYAPAELYLARAHDAAGEKANAIVHYQHFVDIWRDCDPEQRPILHSAQARLAELQR